MKIINIALSVSLLMASCNTQSIENKSKSVNPLLGTWKLQTGVLIEKGDTTTTDYTKEVSFIKIINDTHFAFIQHDLAKGKGAKPVFSAGGGSYTFSDSTYTEHLEYCNERAWEDNKFSFTITVRGDTLVQKGVEKIEGTDVNRLNIETYVKVKK
ncbi:MAG: hypothetical protein JNL70_19325 [Saprospiraceae bacterium]|nr:hypothetical protein [Saprospiraceae bacterium]